MGLFGSLFRRTIAPNPEMDKLYGSGHLFTEGVDDLTRIATYPRGCSAVALGTNGPDAPKGAIWVPDHDQGHTFTIGATRSGKFVSLLAPALMTYSGGVFVIDPKAESAWACANRRRAMGQRVVILDPWEEINRRYGDQLGVKETVSKFNPLAHIDPKNPDFGDEVTALADALIVTQGNESQPHFPDSAREFVAGIMAALVEKAPGLATFAHVRKLLTAPDEQLAAGVKRIILERPDSLAAKKLGRYVTPGNNELSSIRSTASTQTAMLDTLRLLSSMESTSDAFDMAELGTSNVSLFVVLPVDKLQIHGRWLRLILTLAVKAIARQARPPSPPVLFMLDEMGSVGKLDVIENAVGLLAGQGVRIWGFLQDLSQLQRDYPRSWETFFANSSNIILLGIGDITTAEYFSRHMGTRTISHLDTTYNGGQSGLQGSSGWSQAFQFHGRALMLPQEIMQKPADSALILRQGGPYMLLKKSVYHKETRWQGLYRDNPNYMTEEQLRRLRLAPPAPLPQPLRRSFAKPRVAETRVIRCTNPGCRQSLRVPFRRVKVTCPGCRNSWMFDPG